MRVFTFKINFLWEYIRVAHITDPSHGQSRINWKEGLKKVSNHGADFPRQEKKIRDLF